MSDFNKTIGAILGYGFGALLLIFTAIESWTLLADVTGSPLVATVGLIMFEGGFLYWAWEFRRGAAGLGQMAIALLTSLADFAAVVAAVALRLGAVDAQLLGPETAARLVVTAVLVNLAAKYAYTLASPATSRNISARVAEGLILRRTFRAFEQKTAGIADVLADDMAADWLRDLRELMVSSYTAVPGPAAQLSDTAGDDLWRKLAGILPDDENDEEPDPVAPQTVPTRHNGRPEPGQDRPARPTGREGT